MRAKIGLAAVMLGLAMLLSACGAASATPNPAQVFIREHTQCSAAEYSNIQWAPDGASLIYNIRLDPYYSDIRSIRPDGTDDHLLVEGASTALFSSDGKFLLTKSGNRDASTGIETRVIDLATMDTLLQYGTMSRVSWLPDSHIIAYFDGYTGRYAQMPIDTREASLLAEISGLDISGETPAWAADGAHFAYEAEKDLVTVVKIVSTNDGHTIEADNPRAVSCPELIEHPAGWSPDSHLLTAIYQCSQGRSLRVIDQDGNQRSDWWTLQQNVQAITWSRDGKQLGYVARLGGISRLYTANMDGSDIHELYQGASQPAWSPDGSQIAFVGTDAAGYSEIMTVRPDGTGLRQITTNPANGQMCLH